MTPARRILLLAAALLASPLALAHTGAQPHAHAGFLAGWLHPFTGADHLVAMVAVGAWSAIAVRRVWAAPLAFVALLACGALAGAAALAVPGIEPMIAASLLVVGLLLATVHRVPALLAAAVAGAFAFFHGAAHGVELGGGAAALAGMLLATAALHAAGIGIGRLLLARHRWLPRVSGASVALLGATLLLGLG
ncbi:MAG TPA: HupE/UreJ family protein [Ramlibacter sp.]|jgi:urease accessory protein|uniref:HupE/UreJ family protein n=1 Tax=Ramlibacter sp. TaxID=1917967 RepID=UPI002D252485|nr:HupE/UreJ family protein [Ramlibacter sp.]HZY19996.1 HupE/UreJ family protein [Ramlibacter sp.]